MNLLRFFKRPVQTRQMVTGLPVTLREFRSNDRLTKQAGRILASAQFGYMLNVLQTESPHNTHLALGNPMEERALHQARIEGYNLCLNNLLAMGKMESGEFDLEATFEEPEQKEQVKQ